MEKAIPMTYIIAEAGTNYCANNGTRRFEAARRFILAAKHAGADAVKFQVFFPGEPLFCQMPGDETRWARWNMCYLEESGWEALNEYAKSTGIDMLLSVFQMRGIELLKRLKPRYVKVASRAMLSFPYKLFEETVFLISSEKPLNHSEKLKSDPGHYESLSAAFLAPPFYTNRRFNLYCVPRYPTPLDATHLLHKMAAQGGLLLTRGWLGEHCRLLPDHDGPYDEIPPGGWKYHGLSDHSGTLWPGIAAIFDGAQFLEVHFNIDGFRAGNDAPVCLATSQLKFLCDARDAAKVMRQ